MAKSKEVCDSKVHCDSKADVRFSYVNDSIIQSTCLNVMLKTDVEVPRDL